MSYLIVLCIGLLFGLGLVVSGMSDPAVVLAFLDPMGQWDPSLGLVLAGALPVTFVGYWLILKRPAPAFASQFSVPSRKDIDTRLILGAALFGIGWGLVGLCPGPALTALTTEPGIAMPFFIAMLAGIYAAQLVWNK